MIHHARLARPRRWGVGLAATALICSGLAAVPPGAAYADAPTSCGSNSASNGDACVLTASDATHLRIDQPFVAGPSYEYRSVVFQPGDTITLNAGGCVQTGGLGATWKRYVNPTGSNSGFPAGLYWAWVTIPGAFFADNPLQPVNHVPFLMFTGPAAHSFIIPGIAQPTDFVQPIDLIIGYTDDNYDDNSYSDHDDGNDDQCAFSNDGGPAWVTVSVQHGTASPMPAVHPKPFDLVPAGFDSNRLFKNPAWGWQTNQGSVDTDGSYSRQCFAAPPCTSQVTDEDRIGADFWEIFGLCGGSPPNGHRNWFDVTYGGQISFEDWDSPLFGDDDYNMQLRAPDVGASGPAGATQGNPTSVKLEFDSDETIDHFGAQPWWSLFHFQVENDNRAAIDQMVKDHDAVVIGLMGVDEVHAPGGAEVHPVHVLAIREAAPGSIDPADDSWAIFARNWGNEGECGSQQHYLNANTVTVDLPRPGNVPATAAATLSGDNTFIGHGAPTGPAVHNATAGVQVTFSLANGSDRPWQVGELHLNWTGQPSPAPAAGARHPQPATAGTRAAASAVAPDDQGEPEDVLADIWNAMSPAQQQTATTLFTSLNPPAPPDSQTSTTAQLTATAPAMPAATPAVSQAPDPVWAQRIHAMFHSGCAATGGNLPTQPAWCPTLNLPPMTTLTTAGGTPGPGGWAVTPVTATLTAHDSNGSGIARTEYSFDGQTWTTYTGPVVLPDGAYTLWYRSQDKQGNVEVANQHPVRIDTTAPVITVNQPTATQYPHSDTLTLHYTVTDGPTAGLGAGSGVASVVTTLDGRTTLAGHGLADGQKINLLTELPLGEHNFTVTAKDYVGHVRYTSVTFTIIVTPQSIKDAVDAFFRSGDITNPGLRTSLLAKLDAAGKAWTAGNCTTARNIYGAFINEINAHTGNGITATAADILIKDARYLQTHCNFIHSNTRPLVE
jgi:FIMAH domain